MRDLKYRYNDNHHFNETIYHDTIRLMDRFMMFHQRNRLLPTDEENMKFFGWTKDHLNRCFQMMREMGIVDYVRNHRRTTLKFLGEYSTLNGFIQNKKKAD